MRSSEATAHCPTLTQLGINKTQSSRWQKLADVAPSIFETYIADAKTRAEEGITAASRNAVRNKHYWLTPPDLYAKLEREFGPFDYDPTPYPRPKHFDGLKASWGKCSYVNPMFQGGMTAWAKKAVAENQKGKTVVMVFPLDGWIHMLLNAGATIRSIGDVKWCAIEDGTVGSGSPRPIAAFILRGRRKRKSRGSEACARQIEHHPVPAEGRRRSRVNPGSRFQGIKASTGAVLALARRGTYTRAQACPTTSPPGN